MPVWWDEAQKKRDQTPYYTLDTGWAVFMWDRGTYGQGRALVDLVPIKPGGGRGTKRVTLEYEEGQRPEDLGFRPLSTMEMLDLMLRIAGLRGTPTIREPFSGGLLEAGKKSGQMKYTADALVTRQNIYKDGIKSADPVVFARILNDMFERTRLQRTKGMQEIEFEGLLYVDTVLETSLVLGVTETEARRVVARRVGFDPVTLVRRRIRKEKTG